MFRPLSSTSSTRLPDRETGACGADAAFSGRGAALLFTLNDSVKVISVPTSGVLCTVMFPPMASMSLFTIDMPRPVPR